MTIRIIAGGGASGSASFTTSLTGSSTASLAGIGRCRQIAGRCGGSAPERDVEIISETGNLS